MSHSARQSIEQRRPVAVGEQRQQVAGLLGAPAGGPPFAVRRRPGRAHSASPSRVPPGGDVDDTRGRRPAAVRPPRTCPSAHRRAPACGAARRARPGSRRRPASYRPAPPARRARPAAGPVRVPAARRGRGVRRPRPSSRPPRPPPAAGPARRAAVRRPAAPGRTAPRPVRPRTGPRARSPAAGRAARRPSGDSTAYPVPGASVATARTRWPVVSGSRCPSGTRAGAGSPGGISTGGPSCGCESSTSRSPAEGVPGAGGGERDARRQVEQHHAVDEDGGRAARALSHGERAGRAGAVGQGQALGAAGAEQSQFHATIVSRPAAGGARGPPCGCAGRALGRSPCSARALPIRFRGSRCPHFPRNRGDNTWRGRGGSRRPTARRCRPRWSRRSSPTQGDAESWVGEVWKELAEGGADQVSLFDGDTQIYGPMSLHEATSDPDPEPDPEPEPDPAPEEA